MADIDTELTLQRQGPLIQAERYRQAGVHSKIDTSCRESGGGGRDLYLREMYLHQKS